MFDPVRLHAVRGTGLLDAATQDAWQGLTALAARLLHAPMAFLTLVDDERSFWLSTEGVDRSLATQNPVEESFCQYVIADRAPLVIDDATADARVCNNPSVTGMGVRAWAGFPVMDTQGQALGSFCVMDVVPRVWSEQDVSTLEVLAQAASAQIAVVSALRSEQAARDDLHATRQAERAAERRLDQLATVTLQLVGASDLAELTEIIVDRALPVLGADGGAVLVHDGDHLTLMVSARLDEQVQVIYGRLPVDSPLPACHVARTGQLLTLPNRSAGLAFLPEMAQVYEDTQRPAWVFAPLRIGGKLIGSLSVCWTQEREDVPADEINLIEAFAAQCATALDRIRIEQDKRAATLHTQKLAEALQRSLLTQPASPKDMSIAVRYLPAVQSAQVGGDWHDAHDNGLGSLLVSVGDVAGHESNSAAAMAQIRNLLRGLAVDSDDSPAVLLSRLDHAMDRFGLDTLATALLGRIDASASDRRRGLVRLRWSSAGHLPPLVRLPDGAVRILSTDSDPMLGISPASERVERVTELPYGCTLVLYTDGLVERRDESISDGLQRLAVALRGHGHLPVEELCDALLAAVHPDDPDDDTALLVLRLHDPATRDVMTRTADRLQAELLRPGEEHRRGTAGGRRRPPARRRACSGRPRAVS